MKITTESYQEIIGFCEEGLKEEALYGTQFEIQFGSKSSKPFYINWAHRIAELIEGVKSQVCSRTAKVSLNIIRD
jgi:hypothetical protein